jgi:hypothetical protein
MSSTLNIRIKEETLQQIDTLQKLFDAPSRSDVIRRAIEMSDHLADAIEKGYKVTIEGKNGCREVMLPGLITKTLRQMARKKIKQDLKDSDEAFLERQKIIRILDMW